MNAPGRATAGRRDLLAAAMEDVLDSGWYVHGPQHDAFQAELASYLGVPHALGVGNGTDAIELALRGVAASASGRVVTAANAGGYTTTAARRGGFDVGYADVDPTTLCLSAATVEEALAAERVPPAAVVVTHLYGRMAPVAEILAVCRLRGVPLVEDCAQAIGARRSGQAAGSVGDVATFSFYPTKNLGALGDGGAVTTSQDGIAERVSRLRQYGWAAKYTIMDRGGSNTRLDELQAAVLRIGLRVVDAGNARRREIISRYAAAAGGGPLSVLPATGEDHVGHLCVGLSDDRDDVRRKLDEAGVRTDVHYPVPDHRQPAYADHYQDVSLPVTEAVAERVMSLPCFPELTEDEIEQVCSALECLQ